MAKYIITSIPQYRNGGSKLKKEKNNNNFFDFFRKKNRNSKKEKEPVVQSGFNAPVEEEFVIPTWADTWPAEREPYEKLYSNLPEYTTDPNQQDKPISERTGLELVSTQPEFGNAGYGYKKDPFTGELKTVPAGTPTYEGDIFNRLVTNVKANPDIPVDYQGNPLKCGPGTRPYKGVCVTDEEYAQIKAKEEENVNYRDQEEQKARQKRIQEANENYRNRYNSYISDIDKGIKKGDKHKKDLLIPFETYTKKDIENDPKLKGDYDNKSSNLHKGYYIEKKDLGKDDYEINLYPKGAITTMMTRMKPFEFEKYHGLNAKQLQTEFGDYLKYIDQYHVEQGAEMINKLTKQGYSAEDAKRQLVKNGYNDEIGVTQFKDIANAYDIKNNADTYFVDDNLVMYKKDKTGKVYKYTNSYGNDNFSVGDSSKYKESDNPLKDTKNWIWESVDPSKVKTNKEGNITVNGRSADLYDYGFGDRPGDRNDKAILSKYTTAVGKHYKESEEEVAVGSQQNTYNHYNNTMYDNVYSNNPDQKLSTIPAIGSGLNDEYVTAYNNTVSQINKTNDVNKKAKLLEDFNSKTNKSIKVSKPDGKGFYEKKVNIGSFDNYGEAFNNRDVKAYKTASGLKNQMDYAKENAAQEALQYAYANKINPGSKNLNYVGYDGSKYTGEEGDQTLPFEIWSQTADAQEFVKNYKNDPNYAEKLYDVEKNRAEKKWQDYQNENSLWKKPTLSNFLEKAGQQIGSLTNQPVYTLNQWASGKEIDPMIGLMNGAPTQSNINNWEAKLGPGGSRLFLDKHTALNKDLSTQIVNLVNPGYYANQAGMGLRNLYEGDPDQGVGDVALNAAFAALPASKFLRGVSAAKLLPGGKYVGKLANNRLYNATRNLITPGAGLTGMFVKDAFLPTGEIDPNTGEEIQGFGVEAGKNIWNEIEKAKEKSKISNSLPESSSPFSSLDYLAHLDSDKVKENLFGLGMAGMIGLHGGKTALRFGKDLYRGVPNRLPPGMTIMNDRYNFKMDPAQFNQQFYRSKLDPKEPLRLKKEGGDLPQAKMGWPPKGLKKITRSNYNPISYPIKKIGYKIAVQQPGHSRTKEQILQGIKGTSEDTYWGQQISNMNSDKYGPGKRDLLKNYFFGDETGFEPIDYNFAADAGLDAMVQEYGPLKAFLLNSMYRHEKPINWYEFTGESLNKDLNKHEPFLDFTFPHVDFNKNVTEVPIYLHSNNYLSNAFANPENALITEKTKKLAKDRFNKLFDQYGSDTIPVDIGRSAVSGPLGKRPFLDLYNSNPVRPKDNIGGHMGFLKRLPNGEFDWVTRDLWSFRPGDYDTKWNMGTNFQKAQTQLMDMFGKPFVLTQTNPIEFKEGGSSEDKMEWPPKGLRSRRTTSTVFGKPTYKPSSTYFNKGIKTGETFSSIKKLPTSNVDIKYPIQFGNEPYKLPGESTYYVDPLDYGNAADWQKEGIIDYLYNETREPTTLFPELEKNVNNVEGSDISIDLNKLGDFKFKPWSNGWEVRNQMMNAFDGPQQTLSKSDFWTNKDLKKSIKLNEDFTKHQDEFMEHLSVDDVPGFIQKYPHLAEIFNNNDFKFPRKKFYANEKQKEAMYKTDPNYALINPLDKHHLNSLTKGYISSDMFSKLKNDSSLPSINSVNRYDTEWLSRLNPYDYFKNVKDLPEAAEILKGIGNIDYLPKAEVQALQQKLIQARLNTFVEAAKKDMFSTKKLTGKDAWNKITSQPGWKNKNGGVSVQLSKKEIDKYIQGGYIVEEE